MTRQISDRLELELRRIASEHGRDYDRTLKFAAWCQEYYFDDPSPSDDRRPPPPRAPISFAVFNAVKADHARRAN